MLESEFDKSSFFFGIKAKVSGEWFPLLTCDFEKRTVTLEKEETEIPCFLIEELEELKPRITANIQD